MVEEVQELRQELGKAEEETTEMSTDSETGYLSEAEVGSGASNRSDKRMVCL